MRAGNAWVWVVGTMMTAACMSQEPQRAAEAVAAITRPLEGGKRTGQCQAGGKDLLLDDMEDNDYHVSTAEGRLGIWYTFNGGGCNQYPLGDKKTAFQMTAGGQGGKYMAATAGKSCQAGWSGGGFGFQFLSELEVKNNEFVSTPCKDGYNASAYDGVSFDLRIWKGETDPDCQSADPMGVRRGIRFQVCTRDVTNFNCHGFFVSLTDDNWHTIKLPWKLLQQEEWGSSTQKVSFNPARLDAIQWKASAQNFHLAVDNVRFLEGTQHAAPQKVYVGAITREALETEFDIWKSRHLSHCADGRAEVVYNRNSYQAVSEGTGYGMLLAATLDDRGTFDRLLKGFLKRKNGHGMMAWSFGLCNDSVYDWNAASDADLDIAMALILASRKGWTGDFQYGQLARDLITAIQNNAISYCTNGLAVIRLGDTWGGCKDQGQHLNPSYFSPAFYREFGRFVPDQADTWNRLANDAYKLLRQYQEKMDNLVPDWAFSDGSPKDPVKYGYEACRVPMRIATDFIWNGSGDARGVLDGIYDTVNQLGGPKNATQYVGTVLDINSCMLGGFTVSALPSHADQVGRYSDEWLGAIMHSPTESVGDNPYFQGTIRLIYLALISGHFTHGR